MVWSVATLLVVGPMLGTGQELSPPMIYLIGAFFLWPLLVLSVAVSIPEYYYERARELAKDPFEIKELPKLGNPDQAKGLQPERIRPNSVPRVTSRAALWRRKYYCPPPDWKTRELIDPETTSIKTDGTC